MTKESMCRGHAFGKEFKQQKLSMSPRPFSPGFFFVYLGVFVSVLMLLLWNGDWLFSGIWEMQRG